MRTAADLAAAIPGGVVKESTIQNVEAGRKAELTVSQLLNIALALGLPPVYLLAPVANPLGELDLANLSSDFDSMSILEFDAWLSGSPNGSYHPASSDEHRDQNLLQTMRELDTRLRERARLTRILELEAELRPSSQAQAEPSSSTARARIEDTSKRIAELAAYLTSAGWNVDKWTRQ
jgi:transcriptional regulator with XRE-family HTH domain